MRLELTGRHVDITPALRRLVDTKLAKLERVLNDRAVSAQAVLSRAKNGCRADLTLHARGETFLHGVGKGGSWEPAVGDAVAKILQQAQKVKTKWQNRTRRGQKTSVVAAVEHAGAEAAARPREKARPPRPARPRLPRILRSARQAVKPMSVGDAARELEANGAPVVFRDTDTQSVSVLYRSANGELTLVETEA
jgi:putative sigma-54 modulation protein